MQTVNIIDATLREGNQAPGVAFSVDQARRIARLLETAGVDMIECGHAAVGEVERQRIRSLLDLDLGVPLLSHARAHADDIAAAKASGAQWVGIFCGINRVSRLTRLGGREADSVVSMIRRGIAQAKSLGLQVRYTVEDGSRTPLELVIRVLEAAVREGADRVCYADTLGAMTPGEFGAAVHAIRQALPRTDLEVHIHDDRGFAMANAWAAIEAGANWVSTSVNGIGERCGITDLAPLCANLDLAGGKPLLRPHVLQELSRFVAACTRSRPDDRRPIVGRNAFTHTARLHTEAMRRSPAAYAVFDARRFHREVEFAPPHVPLDLSGVVVSPQVISATELKYHRAGPGSRYVMIDDRFVKGAGQYCIVRDIPHQASPAAAHVDPHRHVCDSLFLFIGKAPDLAGLSVEVMLDGDVRTLESPAAMFIPAGAEHSYRILGGSGLYLNHVLAGDYNASLLEPGTPTSGAAAQASSPGPAERPESTPGERAAEHLVREFLSTLSRRTPAFIGLDLDLVAHDVIDSLGLLELFDFIETARGGPLPPAQMSVDAVRSIRGILALMRAPRPGDVAIGSTAMSPAA